MTWMHHGTNQNKQEIDNRNLGGTKAWLKIDHPNKKILISKKLIYKDDAKIKLAPIILSIDYKIYLVNYHKNKL